MIPPEFIRSLIDRTEIVSLISRDLQLKKAGANHIACCPFHHEKTPSFTVSASKQFFHCFGCGAHGTVINYLMKRRNLEYIEAIHVLAEINGVEVPQSSGGSTYKNSEFITLYKILDESANFYSKVLENSQGALSYLENRKISKETISRFRLGVSPDSFDGLHRYFTNTGFIEGINKEKLDNFLVRSGMAIASENKPNSRPYDRFRNRLMVPIIDRRNRVIGFGGRTMGDDEPKYLNSPETNVFQKGRELYGLAQAITDIRKSDSVIVVEGYFDVISLSQSGISNVVATMGTAITPEQISVLWAHCQKIVFCFDGDSAGEKATHRAIERVLPAFVDGKTVSIVRLPDKCDPDDLVKTRTVNEAIQILNNGLLLSGFLLQTLKQNFDDSAEAKAVLVQKAASYISSISSERAPIFKNDLLSQIAEVVGMPVATVLKGIPLKENYNRYKNINRERKWTPQTRKPNIELILLREALNHPQEIGQIIAGAINHESQCYQCLQIINDAYENLLFPDSYAARIGFLEEKGFSDLVAMVLAEEMREVIKINPEDIDFRTTKSSNETSNSETKARYDFLCTKMKTESLSDDEKEEFKTLLPKLKTNYINDKKLGK